MKKKKKKGTEYINICQAKVFLVSLSNDSLDELHVLGHDGASHRVYSALVRDLAKIKHVGLGGSFLEAEDGRRRREVVLENSCFSARPVHLGEIATLISSTEARHFQIFSFPARSPAPGGSGTSYLHN